MEISDKRSGLRAHRTCIDAHFNSESADQDLRAARRVPLICFRSSIVVISESKCARTRHGSYLSVDDGLHARTRPIAHGRATTIPSDREATALCGVGASLSYRSRCERHAGTSQRCAENDTLALREACKRHPYMSHIDSQRRHVRVKAAPLHWKLAAV
jgi:hypothetical protein